MTKLCVVVCGCFLLLLGFIPSSSVVHAKNCITLSRGKELKEYLPMSHVLLVLGGDEKEEAYLQLCNRLETTPESRSKDFEIAFVNDSNLKRHVMKSAKLPSLGMVETVKQFVKNQKQDFPTSYPEYILYHKQEQTTATEGGIRFGGSEKTADTVSNFVAQQLQRKNIGNFVYSLGTYDLVASQIVSSTGLVQKVWALAVARFIQVLFLQHPFSSKESQFERDLVQEYIRIGLKVVEKGTDYPSQQVTRLQNMMDNDSGENNSIGPDQRETLSQRIYTLQKFSEPIDVDPHDLEVFIMKMALNFVTLCLMLIMIPFVLMTTAEEEEEESRNEEMEEPKIDSPNEEEEEMEENNGDDNDEPIANFLTKQEKRALAMQRAKESMQADKQKVEQVKRKNHSNDQAEKDTSGLSESELNNLTVSELKDMLRDRGLKVSGKKAELIVRLVEHPNWVTAIRGWRAWISLLLDSIGEWVQPYEYYIYHVQNESSKINGPSFIE